MEGKKSDIFTCTNSDGDGGPYAIWTEESQVCWDLRALAKCSEELLRCF